MPREYRQLAISLKQLLKARRVTYRDAAARLGVSEQTIKRLLTAEDGSVGRLAALCDAVGVSFFDLARAAGEDREQTFRLRPDQEEHFCAHPEDYAFFDSLLRERGVAATAARFDLPPALVRTLLRRLEAIGVLERLPADGARLTVSGTHNWIDGGPLQARFLGEETARFMAAAMARIAEPDVFATSSDRRLSAETLRNMIAELREVFIGYRRRAQTDEALLPDEHLFDVRWACGVAPMPPPFDEYLRSAGAKARR